MSTNAEDFRASFERARGSALTTAVAGCSGSGDGPPEEAEEPNEPAAGEEGSNTEAPEEETTDTDAEEQPEPEPTKDEEQSQSNCCVGEDGKHLWQCGYSTLVWSKTTLPWT